MNAIQRSELGMGMAVRDYLALYSAITAPLPTLTANVTVLQTTILQIQAMAELQDFEKTGIADNKQQLKGTVVMLAADASRKLTAYAMFTGNTVLLKEIKIGESVLMHQADADLKTKAQEIYDRAQANVAALATYGITAASQTALLNAINAFNAAIPKPRLGIDERKQATQQLVVLFETMDRALKNIDAAVAIVKNTQPVFYKGYETARKVIGTGSKTVSVKGLVTDAATGEPVKGVTVTFALDGGTPEVARSAKAGAQPAAVTKKTAEKGGLQVKSLPTGTYTVTLRKAGYADEVVTIYVNDGEMTVLNVSISRN